MEVYSNYLKAKLREIDEKLFTTAATNYKADPNFENYYYPFFEAFMQLLERLFQSFEDYSENVFKLYGQEGFILLVRRLITNVAAL